MSYFEGQLPAQPQQPWQQPHGRHTSQPQQQQPWSQQSPSLEPQLGGGQMGAAQHSGAQGPGAGHGEPLLDDQDPSFGAAFDSQFDEIDRALENLFKSGKTFSFPLGQRREVQGQGMPGGMQGGMQGGMPAVGVQGVQGMPGQGIQMGFGQFPPMDPMAPQQFRRPPMYPEYGGMRNQPPQAPSGYPGFVAGQRYARKEPEATPQGRRAAAQARERELRNFHQEQQYNRNLPTAQSDRSLSPAGPGPAPGPGTDDHRELLARQHRALYGENSSLYVGEPRPLSNEPYPPAQDAPGKAAPDTGSKSATPAVPVDGESESPTRAGASAASAAPASGTPVSANPGGPGTIGSRPGVASTGPGGKRSTPPAGLSFGERENGASSAGGNGEKSSGAGLGWGGNGNHGHPHGPWGGKGNLGQASVWG